jgi:hypothetical protein
MTKMAIASITSTRVTADANLDRLTFIIIPLPPLQTAELYDSRIVAKKAMIAPLHLIVV